MAVPRTLAALILTASFIATACSASGGSPGGSPSVAGQGLPSGDAGAVAIGTASSRSLGTFLTGPNGMTLYTHAGDGPNASTCTGVSATARPPLTVTAGRQPTAGAGVTGKLPTLTRADGTTQVTYGGLPLYDWQGDPKPDDTPVTSRRRGAQS
jgi:predicted lipoprotein with Yx(FWY)xxD motif